MTNNLLDESAGLFEDILVFDQDMVQRLWITDIQLSILWNQSDVSTRSTNQPDESSYSEKSPDMDNSSVRSENIGMESPTVIHVEYLLKISWMGTFRYSLCQQIKVKPDLPLMSDDLGGPGILWRGACLIQRLITATTSKLIHSTGRYRSRCVAESIVTLYRRVAS